MNKQRFRLVFSKRMGMLVPVAEDRAAQGKASGDGAASGGATPQGPPAAIRLGPSLRLWSLRKGVLALLAAGALGALLAAPQSAHAAPSGASVASGTASITHSGNATTIVNSPNAIINWASFSAAQQEVIRRFELDDQAGLAPERLGQVQGVFDAVRGPSRTLGELTTARVAAQALLDHAQPGELAVSVPEQTLQDARVRVVITSLRGTRIARVRAVGASGFDEANVRASVPALAEGVALDTGELDRELRLGELHPFKRTSVTLARQGDGTPAALVTAQAERSALGFLTTDNFGPREARARVGAGYVQGNLTGADDVLALNYMSALERERLQGLSVSYALPLYRWGQMVELSASHSRSDSARTVELFHLNGAGTAASAKWSYVLPRYAGADLRLTAAYLYHRTRSRVTFEAREDLGSLVPSGASAPLSVGLEGELRPTGLGLPVVASAGVSVAHNFAGRFGSTDAPGLSAIRLGAGDFTLTSARLRVEAQAPGGWQLRASALGQATGNALTAADQLNVVGPYAVRGFRDAALLGDRAVVASAEVATPVLASVAEVGVRGWGFVDYGAVGRNHALAGELDHAEAAATGLGLRGAARWGSLEVYLARKIAGRAHDADASRYSLWVNAALRF